MKFKYTLIALCLSVFSIAQVPANYYDTAAGLTGYTLKSELARIITANYDAQSYSDLRNLYAISDNDVYYDNGQSGTILDIYSENPSGSDPYNFSSTNTNDRCGNYSGEGDCWNREHIFPQGFFNQLEPMRSDAHHVVPTDGFVNGGRSNLPFGIVNANGGSSVRTYQNGSLKGPSATPGYGGDVFEPIDEFKGDVARMLLYFATRYQSSFNDNRWDSANATNDPRDGSLGRFYEQWYIDLLIDWHLQDPVSQREIDRNNDIYNFQNNANPYIDNPQFVTMIWTSTTAPSGSIFATLSATYNDVNNNGFDAGDEINYDYTIENIGNTILYNVSLTADRGTFANTVSTINSIAPNQVLTNPFGNLQVLLNSQDLAPNNNLCLVINQLTVNADFASSGTTGGLTIRSDDPSNTIDVDQNGDMLPDDSTQTVVCANSANRPNNLFISEYIEGSGTNKAIEIANFTGRTIDLSSYSIQRNSNGGGSWSGNVTLSGSLNDGEVYVMARGNADASILSETDQLVGSGSAFDFNGNDPVGLFQNSSLIDIVGVFNSGSSDFAKDVVLVRKDNAAVPNLDFNLSRDWISYAQSDFTHIGDHDIAILNNTEDQFSRIKIYPNPSNNGVFFIDNSDPMMEMSLFDLSGRQISLPKVNDRLTIQNSGIYILRLHINDASKTYKLIVR